MAGSGITFSSMARSIERVVPDENEIRRRVRLLLNRAMLVGLSYARQPANTPKLTGQLIRSITITKAVPKGGDLEATMLAGVEYARRQEYEHPTKSLYLLRAIQRAQSQLESDLGDAKNIIGVQVR